MKYSHKEFEMKIKFLSDGVDKQYHVAMQKSKMRQKYNWLKSMEM